MVSRKKKREPRRRNPVIRELLRNPKRNAGAHQRKKSTKRDERRLEE